jgi:hypothetical protein
MTGSGAKRPFARVQMLAPNGHDAMSDLSPLLAGNADNICSL